MTQRSLPQNAKFHALVRDIAARVLLVPWKRAIAQEALKRYLIVQYVRDARLEAYGAGQPDPFPVRPVPSHQLDVQQMNDLITSTEAWCAINGIEIEEPTTKEHQHETP